MFKKMWEALSAKTMLCLGWTIYFLVGLSATIIDTLVCKVEKIWLGRYDDKLFSLNHLKLKIISLVALITFCVGIAGVISVKRTLGGLETEVINSENKRKAEAIHFESILKTNKEMVQFRADYGEVLSTSFKKNMMQAEVIVSGTHNETMKINCLFFDSRWPPVIEKGGLLESWKSFGFKKVTISDTIGYSYTWVL